MTPFTIAYIACLLGLACSCLASCSTYIIHKSPDLAGGIFATFFFLYTTCFLTIHHIIECPLALYLAGLMFVGVCATADRVTLKNAEQVYTPCPVVVNVPRVDAFRQPRRIMCAKQPAKKKTDFARKKLSEGQIYDAVNKDSNVVDKWLTEEIFRVAKPTLKPVIGNLPQEAS